MERSCDGSVPFRRVALIGSIANPNVGDEAILEECICHIEQMFGDNCVIYVFSKDASLTSLITSGKHVVPVDYLNRISKECGYTLSKIRDKHEELLSYEAGSRTNLVYEEIHSILSKVDVLHIIGGGYLNGIWPDMLEEVRVATHIAKGYGARVLCTGIGVFPITNDAVDVLSEILHSCDRIDFRDDSFTTIEPADAIADIRDSIQLTTDDAIHFGQGAPSYWLAHVSAEARRCSAGRYVNFSVHSCNAADEVGLASSFLAWGANLIENGDIDYVNCLIFDPVETEQFERIIEEKGYSRERFRLVSLVGISPYAAWYVVAHAVCNVGTRYHQAVFSMASGVPALSVSVDAYYSYKINQIHVQFGSETYYWYTESHDERLKEFWASLDEIRQTLAAKQGEVHIRFHRKMEALCEVYAGDDCNPEHLLERVMRTRPVRVSVIVPIYNMDQYLEKCLDSILGQTLEDIEVICVDDGSTDRTDSILYEYAWKDHRVKVISQQNSGVAAARNVGLKAASGEFVFFVDPDDWIASPSALSSLYWAAKEHGVKAACGGFLEFKERTGVVNSEWAGCQSGYDMHTEGLVSYRDYQFDYGWIRFIYDRLTLVSNGFWFPKRKFYEDPVWFTRVMDHIGTFYALQIPVYCYRTGYKDSSMTYEKVVDLFTGMAEVLELANARDYKTLFSLTYSRLTFDYVSVAGPYLTKLRNGEELEAVLERLNAALVAGGGDGHIERLFILKEAERNSTLARKEGFQAGKADVHGSITYKLGDFFLKYPRKIKDNRSTYVAELKSTGVKVGRKVTGALRKKTPKKVKDAIKKVVKRNK